MSLVAPFPYPGGKRKVADVVWSRFGCVKHYIEPFAGSLAVLLGKEGAEGLETVNDIDAMIANFWRALQWAPEKLVAEIEWPVNEADLHARHQYLVNYKGVLRGRVMGDPMFYDVRLAAWWVWGISQWIGSGWCQERSVKGAPTRGARTKRQKPDIGGKKGVHKAKSNVWLQKPSLRGNGVHHKKPNLTSWGKRPHLGWQPRPEKILKGGNVLEGMLLPLAERLASVRVLCGDFERVLTNSVVKHSGTPTAIFMDPPYLYSTGRNKDIYAEDDGNVAVRARELAIELGNDPEVRVAFCGWEGEHVFPESWEKFEWDSGGGLSRANGGKNAGNGKLERIWFSPHCVGDFFGEKWDG